MLREGFGRKVFLMTLVLLFAWLGAAQDTSPSTSKTLIRPTRPGFQHEVRMNRVWSLWVRMNPCAIDITQVRVAAVNGKGELSPWEHTSRELVILQWNRRLPFEAGEDTTYGLHDLLADYGQERYILHVLGTSESGKVFSKFMWVSPAGISWDLIPPAPVRADRSRTEWTPAEIRELSNWYGDHDLTHQHFFREFKVLRIKADRNIEFPLRLEGSECTERN